MQEMSLQMEKIWREEKVRDIEAGDRTKNRREQIWNQVNGERLGGEIQGSFEYWYAQHLKCIIPFDLHNSPMKYVINKLKRLHR